MTLRAVSQPLLLLALCLGGCVTRPTSDVNAFAERSASNSFEVFKKSIKSDGLVLAVVHDRQTSTASCGAHALASLINYWRGAGNVSGAEMYKSEPPADLKRGYSLAELVDVAKAHGLLASPVRMGQADIIKELEAGRPVLIPLQLPGVYVDPYTLPGDNVPVVSFGRSVVMNRAAQIMEITKLAMVSHFVVVVGYESDRFVVVEPVMGYRTISFKKLARYRAPFGDAALVASAATGAKSSLASAAPKSAIQN